MPILITFIAWVLACAFTSGEPISFLIAVMCGVIYSQGRRISLLEKAQALSPLRRQETAAPEDVAPAADEISKVVSPDASVQERPAAPDQIKIVPTPPAQPAASAIAPLHIRTPGKSAPRSTSETIERLFGKTLGGFILKGNPIARIGVIILFFGVIFALKFAAEEGFFPIEVRLLCAALAAFALLGLGWKLRAKSRQFAVTLQGAGTGIFYITSFIAFRLYHLIPGPLAFALLLAATVLTAALAVLENARTLALVAMIGGFLAPALTSEGGGSHILLFSYLALLNLGIFGICWFRSWRELNLTGFFFTFVMASMWGQRYYQPEFLNSSMSFLIFFVLLYTVITVLFTSRTSEEKIGSVDTLMTFGTPLWAFLLQYGLVKNIEYGLAWSATGFGVFYILTAKIIFSRFAGKLKLLVQSYFFIGLCFLSFAVPLAFSGRLTAAIWAVEGLALVWSGIKQKHGLTRFAGQLLVLLSSFFFLTDIQYSRDDVAFLNSFFEGVALLTFAGIFSARLLVKADNSVVSSAEKSFAPILSYIGLAWWFGGGYIEVWRHVAHWHDVLHEYFPSIAWGWVPWALNVYSAFGTFSVLLFWFLSRAFGTHDFRWLRKILMPAHMLALVVLFLEAQGGYLRYRVHPFMSLGFLSWAFVFAAHYAMLWKEELNSETKSPSLHFWGLIACIAVLTWEAFSLVGRIVPDTASWSLSMLAFIPALAVLLLSAEAVHGRKWPLRENAVCYLKSVRVVALWLVFGTVGLDISQSGNAYPLPYLPLLNPLDIGQALALVALIRWWIACRSSSAPQILSANNAVRVISAWGFIWATILLLRCVHHYGGVVWDIDEMLESNTVQAALSIFWSVLALILMTAAHFKGWRPVWKAGACLIAVVVLKLFLVDLSSQATIARIAAFLGVGVLMLCIGYLAPIPPENASEQK